MPPTRATIHDLPNHAGEEVELFAWIRNLRSSGKIAFLILRDGTSLPEGTPEVQAVVSRSEVDESSWEAVDAAGYEASVRVVGTVREDARAPGGFELSARDLRVLGSSADYPIQPKEHGVEFLHDHRHLWLRHPREIAILRIRDEVEKAIRDFFYDRGFTLIDTPILTGSIGEEAGELFETEYFDVGTAYLAQTGQLYAEAAAAAFGKVYCFGPTFRAEKSKTRRHLTEFWMCEPEMAWTDSDGNMALQEDFVAFMVGRVLERRRHELELLERDIGRLESARPPFDRMSYTETVDYLRSKGSSITWGEDLGGEDQTLLTEDRPKPVFVYDFPKEAKAFYMKENPEDPRTVKCDDLYAPEGFGEIIGGSQREDDYDRLLARIREEGLPEEAYGWYLDLRRYGTFPHSGFGLGLERTVGWICGVPHIREVIPFPRTINRLTP